MNNLKTFPKFKKEETVYITGDAAVGTEMMVCKGKVEERLEVVSLGWVYRLENIAGLFEERLLRGADQVTVRSVEPSDMEVVCAVNIDDVVRAHAAAKLRAGDYVRIKPTTTLTSDDRYEGTYAAVVGLSYWAGRLSYDLALLNADDQTFEEDTLPFFEDDLIRVEASEIEAVVQSHKRIKPQLTLIPC